MNAACALHKGSATAPGRPRSAARKGTHMKCYLVAFSALATLPLLACGAGPDAEPAASSDSEALQVARPNPPVAISFDLVTDGNVVDSLFSSVTFSCEGCLDSHVYARYPGRLGNAVSVIRKTALNTPPEFDVTRGVVLSTFTRLASCVSIDALGSVDPSSMPFAHPQGAPWLVAFDASGAVVGQASYTAALGQWQTLSICTGSFNIAAARFSSSTASAFPNAMLGTFDNLLFDQAPLTRPNPILPLPPSVL